MGRIQDREAKGSCVVGVFAFAVVAACCVSSPASAQVSERVSVDSNGLEVFGGGSGGVAMSADGRYVLFESASSNLVPNDLNGFSDVFRHDRQTGETIRVSVSSSGGEANYSSGSVYGSMSGDGRYVAFASQASNLDPLDTNQLGDAYVRDTVLGTTTLVSTSSTSSDHGGDSPSISGDGRYVAFRSEKILAPEDGTSGSPDGLDVYVHDSVTNLTTLVSIAANGMSANGRSERPIISADGRFVAFEGWASNLVPGDTNAKSDVFVRDLVAGTTERISMTQSGQQVFDHSTISGTSRDGRYVAFLTDAAELKDGHSSSLVLRDRLTGVIKSVGLDFGLANWFPLFELPCSVSDDGRYVAFNAIFHSTQSDIYRRDMQSSQILPCDVTFDGSVLAGGPVAGNVYGGDPVISGDGRFVAFRHSAYNLVPNDQNQSDDVFVRDTYVPPPPPPIWTDLGHSLAGTTGLPNLAGTGQLAAGSPVTLALSSAKSFSLAPLVVGLSNLSAPFKGGTLVPYPNWIFPAFTDFFGASTFGGLWPAGVPSGFTTYFQWWIQDPAGGQGYTASNAIAGTAP